MNTQNSTDILIITFRPFFVAAFHFDVPLNTFQKVIIYQVAECCLVQQSYRLHHWLLDACLSADGKLHLEMTGREDVKIIAHHVNNVFIEYLSVLFASWLICLCLNMLEKVLKTNLCSSNKSQFGQEKDCCKN